MSSSSKNDDASSDDGLEKLLGALNLASKPSKSSSTSSKGLPQPNVLFQKAIESSKFTIFESVADLGYYGWVPKGPYKSLSELQSSNDIKDKIDLSATPDEIADIQRINRTLPKKFESLPPQKHLNKFPYSHPYVASLYVATKYRGVDLSGVDFIFGGSTIGVLANNELSNKEAQYVAAVVPGTQIITVSKYMEYEQDYAAPGFQFERLVTGKKFSDRNEEGFVKHMHLMKIGKYQVLFDGQTDATDSEGNPVEISASNPRWWGTQKMFQMLSSGSIQFCAGTKYRGTTLSGIQMMSLSEMIRRALVGQNLKRLETNILQNMDKLSKHFELDKTPPHFMSFDGPSKSPMILKPSQEKSILPPEAIVKELLEIED